MAATSTSASGGKHPPSFFVVLGLLFILLWFLAFMAQIQTNEAWITNQGQVNIFRPDWAILMQIPNYFLNNLSSSEATAAIFGWGIEVFYLGLIVAGFELMTHAVGRSGALMGKIFITIAIILVAFNSYTDYSYGTIGSGMWGHALFAVMMFFLVGFALTIGMFLIETGWKRA